MPADNPFVDRQPIVALTEIWAVGLRNPWRYNFDDPTHGGTGALVIGDVGQDSREEVDWEPMGPGGRNYGWRLREGRQAYDARTAVDVLEITSMLGGSTELGLISSFGVDVEAELYLVSYTRGRILKIVPQ